jgi:hypothetical protein
MKKLIVWAMSLVFAMTVSLAIAADPVKKEATAPAKVEEKAPAEKATAEKAPAEKKKTTKKKKVKKAEPKKEEVKKEEAK